MGTTINKMTLGGLLAALSAALLLLAGIVPGIELTLYAAASFLPAFMIIEFKGKGGVSLYLITLLLGFLLLPNKLAMLPYALFFGLYGILKYYIEKLKSPVLQIGLKLAVFLFMLCAAFYLLNDLFFAGISLPDLATPLLIAAGVLLLFLYDAIFTGIINLYLKKLHPHVRSHK